MTQADLESVYEALAEQLDAIAAEKRPLYLAKLALLLANELGDAEKARGHIVAAAANLDA
jgi:hypothetical protein